MLAYLLSEIGQTLLKGVRCGALLAFCVAAICGAQAADAVENPVVRLGTYDAPRGYAGEAAGMWCADPTDATRLLGITQVDNSPGRTFNPFRSQNEVRISEDGGRTWRATLTTSGSSYDMDPSCEFSEDGVAFVGAMAGYDGFSIWRSEDRGRTWSPRIAIPYSRTFDRPFIVADRSVANRANVYVVGAAISWGRRSSNPADQIVVFRSTDGGRSFREAGGITLPHTAGARGVTHMGRVISLRDGSLVVSWTEAYGGRNSWACDDEDIQSSEGRCGTSVIRMAISRDQGRSFEPATTIAQGRYDLRAGDDRRVIGKWYPAFAAIQGNAGSPPTFLAAWSDTARGRQEILFTRSIDGGRTWERASYISDDAPFNEGSPIEGPNNTMPSLAVSGNGTIAAFFYAQASPAPDATFRPFVSLSHDHGRSWTSPTSVSSNSLSINRNEAAIDLGRSALTSGLSNYASSSDYVLGFSHRTHVPTCNYPLVALADGAFLVFPLVSSDSGLEFEVRRYDVPGLRIYRQLDQSEVELNVEGYSIPEDRRGLMMRISVSNISGRPVGLPIVITATPAFPGTRVEFLNADNARRFNGAQWELHRNGQGTLRPGEKTEVHLIQMNQDTEVRAGIHNYPYSYISLRISGLEAQ